MLQKNKPCHSVLDYEDLEQSDVLFLSDSLKYSYGKVTAFSKKELEIIKGSFPHPFATAAAVKCPSVKEADMPPSNMNICRQHLAATIEKVRPKLVLPCGNLAMKMLIKKSGITTKRGKSFKYQNPPSDFSCVVVPIFHPYSVIREPHHKVLFDKDIQNAYEKYILNKRVTGEFTYKVLTTLDEVNELTDQLKDSEETFACDIETTGLNFLKDEIMSISFSSDKGNYVIPCDHKDSPFRKGKPHYATMWVNLRKILENPKSRKVFHNAKFDLKFLINYGIYTKNVWDTKIMHHFVDENLPKSLMDLVKLYFPNELENL